ncbi:MAG TPA: hypothetical protein VNW92_02310 [Polyangiaceae bacterium]|nr:hypothetical protein [Polyangiaceae bacterium]
MALKLVWPSYLAAVALALGCSNRSLSFGDDPGVLWWTDHETGDLSDWLGKSAAGGYILPGNSRVEVVQGIARSGTHALLITDESPNQRDYPLAARNGPLPLGVYASAWYYLPEPLHPTSYWWFVLYRSRHPPYDMSSFRDEIHLSFTNRPDGTMGTILETTELGTIQPLVDREIPIGRWFHVETYLRATDGSDGEFEAWQDGELTYRATGKMMETTWAEWMTGGVVDGLTTDASQLYIDDAAISQQRLGPLPPFVRE